MSGTENVVGRRIISSTSCMCKAKSSSPSMKLTYCVRFSSCSSSLSTRASLVIVHLNQID
ncbi:Uncharacterised protein [Vibrio cholerae]|nr:Uncharacterised protein [Vibrio cholerae]